MSVSAKYSKDEAHSKRTGSHLRLASNSLENLGDLKQRLSEIQVLLHEAGAGRVLLLELQCAVDVPAQIFCITEL
jgi:hypothetical protein